MVRNLSWRAIDSVFQRGYLYFTDNPVTEALPQDPSQVAGELQARWRDGDQDALQALIPLVYQDLRAMAHRQLKRERPGHTLQTTALVHEAYLRLAGQRPFEASNRAHFVAVAARLMRQILVDYARTRGAAKRGTGQRVELNSAVEIGDLADANVLAVDEALQQLAQVDEQQSRIVELRFFGGLTTEEAAEVLGISRSTAKRDWNVAKAWLARWMRKGRHGETSGMGEN